LTELSLDIEAAFVEENQNGENRSGFAIKIGGKEMTRVAFVRRFGANPDVAMQEQMAIEIEKARKAVGLVQELFNDAGVLQ
jgi:hypothetical protein